MQGDAVTAADVEHCRRSLFVHLFATRLPAVPTENLATEEGVGVPFRNLATEVFCCELSDSNPTRATAVLRCEFGDINAYLL